MVTNEGRTEALDTPGPTDDGPPPGDDAPAEVPAGSSPGGSRLPWIVAIVAILVAFATAIGAAMLVADARRPAADLEAVEQAAGQFALDLTTWDASDGMGDTRERLREAGTETFAADVDELFGGTDDLATLEELGARSDGEVRDVLVQSLEGDEAVALAVVVQRVTTEVTEGEEISLRYARLGLRREGGTWRVDQVELVIDALQQAADRSDLSELPGFGDTDDGAPADADDDADDDATDEGSP
jgi:hypothetical protein